jgi:hypothetical protein
MLRRSTLFLLVLGISAVIFASPRKRKAENVTVKERFEAIGALGKVDLYVWEYSTPDDLTKLAEAFTNGGSHDVQKAASRMEKGSLTISTSEGGTANTIRIFEKQETEKGRRIVAVADRYQDISALQFGGPLTDYPFTCVELHLDESGKGEGILIPFAKITFSKEGKLVIENYSAKPVPLMKAHME